MLEQHTKCLPLKPNTLGLEHVSTEGRLLCYCATDLPERKIFLAINLSISFLDTRVLPPELFTFWDHIFFLLLLNWQHLCVCFLSLLSTWLVILFFFSTFSKVTSITPWAADTTLCCPTYIPVRVSPSLLFSTFLAIPLRLSWAVQKLSQKNRHWVLSTTKLHLPLSLMLTSLPPPFASPLSDVILLSSLFITLTCYWKLLGIFFLSNSLFAFLPVLTVMSLAQKSINSCFALHHFFLSALEVLHTDCLCQHHLFLFLRHHSPCESPRLSLAPWG